MNVVFNGMKKLFRPVRITKLFFRSSVKLGSAHGKQLADFVEDLSESGIAPGMRPHPVGEFLSLSPNMELRVLADENADAIVLVYVDKHDEAYRWAKQHIILE
jgi:hypothetical protein